ncbi:hypothetical protein FOZ60_017241 [Perkinsus olseni]|uniref:Uncharacterized protein n=1 Tax=Perkinsus olseni TaxID=32597 RepID=A0A7J6N2F4_PEROL|nr:hypothetical protein FOZ60_017241 [Perkinsus olseni]
MAHDAIASYSVLFIMVNNYHHTSTTILLLLATGRCSLAISSTSDMEVDPSDSVKCSLSFTYSSGQTETKVVVGAEAMMTPTSRGRNDQFYAELTHVSIADEYVTRSQLDVCTLTHYFNLNQLNRRYHDVWRPSKYGYEATKEGCQQYIKQIGTYAFEKGKMKEQWKAIQVPRTPSYATDKPRFKALFGIAVEAIKYHRVSGRDAIGAYTKSEELHEMLGVDVTGPRSELERITTHLTTNPKDMCHDKLPSIDVEALKEAQRVETIPHRNPDERMRLNVVSRAQRLNRLNKRRTREMNVEVPEINVRDQLSKAVKATHVGLTGIAFFYQ